MSSTLTPGPTRSCSALGRPTSGGKVPKCIGTTVLDTKQREPLWRPGPGPSCKSRDRKEGDVELAQLGDEGHVTEHIGVAASRW